MKASISFLVSFIPTLLPPHLHKADIISKSQRSEAVLHSSLGVCFLLITYTPHAFSPLPITFLFSLCLLSLTPSRGNSGSLPFLKVPHYLEHPEIVLSWVGYHSAKHIIYDILCIFVISLCQCPRLYIDLLF